MRSEKILLKRIAQSHNSAIFEATVPVLHTIRTASGSFFIKSTHKNTPFLPLAETYWRGFFFLDHEQKSQ